MATHSHKLAAWFVNQLASLQFEHVFNPYADFCPMHDTPKAVDIRRRNLEQVLSAAITNGVDSIWIARDLGYRGGRRTGLALTDEAHLDWQAQLLATPPLLRATQGEMMTERTATCVWRMLRQIEHSVFLWNVFPLHPHPPGQPLANRCHTRREGAACQSLTVWLMEILRPRQMVAIGRDAHIALTELGVEAVRIRHPSYGGQAAFFAQITQLYGQNTS